MSKYTTELRFICETESGLTESKGYNSVNEIIQTAIPKIFNFSFPVYDELYRNVLETKILKHFYTREIGFESIGLWKLKLDTKLNEIMPYYNELYKSAMIEFNPLTDYEYTRTGNKNSNGSNNSNSNGKDTNRYSETPQGGLDGIESNTYLTSANIDDSTQSSNSSFTNTDEYLEHITGKRGTKTYSAMLLEYRKTLLNIDMLIINELEELFMLLY